MMGEWWASEAIIFMSGALADPENTVSAMSIYQNTLSICFMIPTRSDFYHLALYFYFYFYYVTIIKCLAILQILFILFYFIFF